MRQREAIDNNKLADNNKPVDSSKLADSNKPIDNNKLIDNNKPSRCVRRPRPPFHPAGGIFAGLQLHCVALRTSARSSIFICVETRLRCVREIVPTWSALIARKSGCVREMVPPARSTQLRGPPSSRRIKSEPLMSRGNRT